MATAFVLMLGAASAAAPAGAQTASAAIASPKLSLIVPPAEEPLFAVGAPTADFAPQEPRRAGGIIAAVEIAPGARLGVGMFGPRPLRGAADPVGPARPKTRRAGVGLSWKF